MKFAEGAGGQIPGISPSVHTNTIIGIFRISTDGGTQVGEFRELIDGVLPFKPAAKLQSCGQHPIIDDAEFIRRIRRMNGRQNHGKIQARGVFEFRRLLQMTAQIAETGIPEPLQCGTDGANLPLPVNGYGRVF